MIQNLITRTLYRATFMHTPASPFDDPAGLQVQEDGGILVENGVIAATGTYTELRGAFPTAEVSDLRGGLLLPGFIDTHVHYPQGRVIGGLGMPLLEWLEKNALPEEARLADTTYARAVAQEFTRSLLHNGTTTALVFGSHFASAVDLLFGEAERSGLRAVAGLVVSDRLLRPELHTTPERAYAESKALIEKWHGTGRQLYAVTPRFSLSASEGILDACAALMREFQGLRFTSHINENVAEIGAVRDLFPEARDYLDTYERAGLVTRRSVLAHNVHPNDRELSVMAAHHCTAAHCPCSNSALGSGLFPLKRHLQAGVHVSLGTDVGGGTGFSMLKEGLQAYFMQQLQGENGVPLTPAHLLYLATRAGAKALDLQHITGDFASGKVFDAVLVSPSPHTPLRAVFDAADSPDRLLAATFATGVQGDLACVWAGGKTVYRRELGLAALSS